MTQYSPSGIGGYGPRPNYLADALGGLADRIGGYLRERRRQAFDDQQRRAGERFRLDLFDRQEASIADREEARNRREDAQRALELRLSHGVAPKASATTELVTLPDGSTTERWVPLEGTEYVQDYRNTPTGAQAWGKAETRAESNRLGDVLTRMSLRNVGNADAPMTGPDFFGVQALRGLEDPTVMRAEIARQVMQPGEDARQLRLYEDKARIDRRYAAPTGASQPRVLTVGGLPYQVGPGGVLQPMRLPDGSQPSVSNRPPTQAQAQRAAFARMAADAGRRLGDNLSDEELGVEGAATPLGMTAPTIGETMRDAVPLVGNRMVPEEYQTRQAAVLQLADAWLRYTSGAAVPETEVARFAKAFTPLYGDKPGTLASKRAARQLVVRVLSGQDDPATGLAQMDALGVRTPDRYRTMSGGTAADSGGVDPLEEIDPDILEALGVP